MKTRTKIIFTILAFFSFVIKSEARTNYIEAVEEIPNVNLYLKINNDEKYISMKKIKNHDTNDLLYSLNPEKDFISENVNAYNYSWLIDLNENLYKEVSKFIYFGYGYQNRTTLNWYIATQYLVWEYVLGTSGEIYFVDDAHNQINLYEEEITAIKNDIAKMYTLPSFVEENSFSTIATLKINEEITFTDNHHVLKDMTIPYIGSSNIVINENKITVSFTEPGQHSLIFTKEFQAEKERQLYKSNDSIVFLSRGTIDSYTGFTYLTILYPSLTINLVDEYNTSLSKEDALYGIYYAPGELYGTFKANEEGKIHLSEIYKGSFYLKELSSPYGFYENSEKIDFKVESDDLNISINKKAILKKVKLRKIVDNDKKIDFSNVTFDIIDTKTNNVYQKITTNDVGEATLNLPYGKFLIRETNTLEGFTKPEDVIIEINENYKEDKYIDIMSEKIKGNIKVQILDENKKLITEKTSFRIKDIKTNSYLLSDNLDIFETNTGSLMLNNLPYGSYILEQVLVPYSYETCESYMFKIENNKETVNINIINKLKEDTETNNIIKDNFSNKIEVPKTGSNEALITLIICVIGLFLGVYICNYNENK